MKNLMQNLQKTRHKLRRKLNDISGKIKIRSFFVFILAVTAILCVRMLINLNPNYITSITSKYSEFLTTKEIFNAITSEITYTFGLKVSNVITSLDLIGNLLDATLQNSIQDSLQFKRKFCIYENVTKCAILTKETHYLQSLQGVYYTTSVYMNLTNITEENWYLVDGSRVLDQVLPQIFLNWNPNFDLYQEINVMFAKKEIIRVYPARDVDQNYFKRLYTDESRDNWFLNAKSISNPTQTYFVFLDSETAIISKPFFNSSSKELLGVVAATISTKTFTQNMLQCQICKEWASFLIDDEGVILNTDLYPNKSLINTVIQPSLCNLIKGNLTNITCLQGESHTNDDLFLFSEVLPGKFSKKSLFYVISSKINQDTPYNSSVNTIVIASYVYLAAFFLLYAIFFYAFARLINIYVKDIINPIKQITYKIHRSLKNLFRRKNISKIQPDDIVIREPTEIREVAENFSQSYKKMTTKNIFLNEQELGEKMILGKQKVIHNKVTEKMLDNIKDAIEKIPFELDTN